MKLYTQPSCPKCKALKKMMDDRKLPYETSEDITEVIAAGFQTVPMLRSDDGEFMDFTAAIKYIKTL